METKAKGIKFLIIASISFAVLFLISVLTFNFVPEIVGNIFFPPSVEYEPGIDTLTIIGTVITFLMLSGYNIMLLLKLQSGSAYKWQHVLITVLFAVVSIIFPIVMSTLASTEFISLFSEREITESTYLFLNFLVRAETIARYLGIISTALAVCAFCGSFYRKK